MIKKIKDRIWFFIHNHRRNRFIARFARLCKNIHRASEHPGYDVCQNGEKAVLSRALSSQTPVIFDIGANVGDWTAMAKSVHSKATIHSFELNPKTAQLLTTRFAGQTQIQIHSFGLSNNTGEIEFFAYSGEESVLSGMRVPLHSHVPHTREKAMVRVGDEVCLEKGIERIDFLKVDAEGADFEVLSGFRGMLEQQKISVIQFEHEHGRYLRDFYDLLAPLGYSIGKLYTNYVDFQNHGAESEHFLGPNYIAIPSSQKELISSLRQGW